MKVSASPLAALAISVLLCGQSAARETVLVIGDSLSREYQFEFPEFSEARNWVELLAVHRPDDFYFGPLKETDLGLIASACQLFGIDHPICDALNEDDELERYRYNWAIPTYSAQSYAGDLAGSSIVQGLIQDLINDDFDNVTSVVVFLGGNDIDSVYSSVYNGSPGAAANIIARIESDLEDIIDFVLDDTPNMRMVLVNVPHVGATPEVKADHPTDPIKTGRVTTALQTLDANLRALAMSKGIGYADILNLTLDLLPDDPYCLGGIPLINESTEEGDAEYIWLGGDLSQSFHPNTNGQAIVANAIVEGFNEKYNLDAQPLSEAEIVEILGLETPLTTWANSFGLPANQRQPEDDPDMDGLNNMIEFALDLDPTRHDTLPSPTMDGENLLFEYTRAAAACDVVEIIPEISTDLATWVPVPPEQITSPGENRTLVTLPKTQDRQQLRLKVRFL